METKASTFCKIKWKLRREVTILSNVLSFDPIPVIYYSLTEEEEITEIFITFVNILECDFDPTVRAYYTRLETRLNGFNICPTFVRQKLGKCWTNVERSVQTASTPFKIFENKGNVVWMLYESLNRFKFDSHAFNKLSTFFTLSTMLDDLFKRP